MYKPKDLEICGLSGEDVCFDVRHMLKAYSEPCQTNPVERLKAVNYVSKKVHLRCLTRFRIHHCV